MNPMISAYAKAQVAFANRTKKIRNDDKGAGFVEYAGVLLVIGVIAAAVITASGDLGENIKGAIGDAIDKAFGKVSEAAD